MRARHPLLLLGLAACDGKVEVFLPDPTATTFVEGVDNPWFPLPVGATWIVEATGDEGLEHIEVVVTDQTRTIEGVVAVVVRDTVTVDGAIVEDTSDWYAQDAQGNVWYLGEDTCEFEDGACVSTEGSWEWGVDGAMPGWAMPANPTVDGRPYYQEYYPGHAEDVGEVIEVGVDVTVPAGSFEGCLRTHDTSTLDRKLDETKTYCREVGNVAVDEGDVREELQSFTQP